MLNSDHVGKSLSCHKGPLEFYIVANGRTVHWATLATTECAARAWYVCGVIGKNVMRINDMERVEKLWKEACREHKLLRVARLDENMFYEGRE